MAGSEIATGELIAETTLEDLFEIVEKPVKKGLKKKLHGSHVDIPEGYCWCGLS